MDEAENVFCAVIFDWDGTLADSTDSVVASFQKVFHKADLSVSDAFIQKRIGIGSRNIIKEALEASNVPFNDRLLSELLKKKIEAEMALAQTVKLFDGALELLDSLSGKIKMGLATMNNRAIIDDLLDRKGIRKYFEVVLSADDVVKPKPDPEVYVKVASMLKCEPPKCVVLEDATFGVTSAKMAGMQCIAITSGLYSAVELRQENPDLIVQSLNEKEKILSFVFNKD